MAENAEARAFLEKNRRLGPDVSTLYRKMLVKALVKLFCGSYRVRLYPSPMD